MYRSGLIEETPGRVAIWLNTSYDEDNTVIGWFDHDYAEVGGHGMKPIEEILQGSYRNSWLDAALAAAKELGITEAKECFLLFNYECDVEPGPFPDPTEPDAIFLGNFDKHRPTT
ncbi:hypothetical protein [Stackebrandtia soli]|uniref:hypothetical protein n=1 Tax=Stackebrandtia soli TaxID=1892856 RepID=UPI0039E7DB33